MGLRIMWRRGVTSSESIRGSENYFPWTTDDTGLIRPPSVTHVSTHKDEVRSRLGWIINGTQGITE
jgi:hypothetical protein